jgi:hypothetical protein
MDYTVVQPFKNPFRPGAGVLPPHLAGRQSHIDYFIGKTLPQEPILTNLIITGLRGVGKTVLLETLKPQALHRGWLWVGSDLSESGSFVESSMSTPASPVTSIKIFPEAPNCISAHFIFIFVGFYIKNKGGPESPPFGTTSLTNS